MYAGITIIACFLSLKYTKACRLHLMIDETFSPSLMKMLKQTLMPDTTTIPLFNMEKNLMLNITYGKIGTSRFEEYQDFSCETNIFKGSHASKFFNDSTRSKVFNTFVDRKFFSNHFCDIKYLFDTCQKSYLFIKEDKMLSLITYEKSLPEDCDTFL